MMAYNSHLLQESWSGDSILHDALANENYKAHKIQVVTVPVKIGIMKWKAQMGSACVIIYQSGRSAREMDVSYWKKVVREEIRSIFLNPA